MQSNEIVENFSLNCVAFVESFYRKVLFHTARGGGLCRRADER
jgi:hypothetical protein